jgi:hypothetical protein
MSANLSKLDVRSLGVSVAIGFVALLAVGCGESSRLTSASHSAAPPQSRPADAVAKQSATRHGTSDFVAAAQSICRRLSREITDPTGTVLNAQALAILAPRHAALERKAVEELSRLRPPRSMSESWPRILAARRTLAAELVSLGRAAKAGDVTAIQRLGIRKQRLYKELATVAGRDRLGACAKAGNVSTTSPIPMLPLAQGAKRTL